MRAGIRNPDGELVAIPRALRAFPRRGHSRMLAAKACLVGLAVRPWLSCGESARAGRALVNWLSLAFLQSAFTWVNGVDIVCFRALYGHKLTSSMVYAVLLVNR